MASRQAVRGGVSAGLGFLLFAVMVVGNYLAARHFFHRFDLTEHQEFTVAPATRKLVSSLDDVVNIKVYFSKNLPEQASSIPARVRDLLLELEAYSRGKIRIESVDPQSSPEIESKVRSMGIPRVPLAVIEKNKQQTIEVYLGLAVLYADQKEVIPVVLDNTNLEYEVARALVRVTRPRKTIGFLTGNGEHDPYGDYRAVGDQLRRQYDVESVDLSAGKTVPEKIATLIVAGPRKPLDEKVRYEIDQHLMRGGNALFLLDQFEIDPSQLMPRPIQVGLNDQLASYGVRVKPVLVQDWGMNEVVQVPGGGQMGMFYVVPYPLWPKLLDENMSASHPIVNQLSTLVLPWTAPLEVTKGAEDKFEVSELVKTSPYAVTEERLFTANPRGLREPAKDQLKQYLVVAAVSGPQRSHFRGKPVPVAATPTPDAGAAPTPEPTPSPAPARKDESAGSQIVVVGGADFATDSMLGQRAFAANRVFFQNAVDWLTSGEELIGIRSRLTAEPMLDPKKSEGGQKVALFANIVFVPGMVAVFGMLWRWSRRRRRVVLAPFSG